MIGILNAYHFDTTPGNYQEQYLQMMQDYLSGVMPGVKFKDYCVAQNEFPADPDECDGYVITGSPASCYDHEAWIKKLVELIKQLNEIHKPLLGICFGHQIIAHALGGEVVKSDKGWGIGVREFSMTSYTPWMEPRLENDSCSLLFSHQDQVVKLPTSATCVAGDSFCSNQMYFIGDHVFSIQGHPEFTPNYAKSRYLARIDRIGEKHVKEAVESLKNTTNSDEVGAWIKNFFKR